MAEAHFIKQEKPLASFDELNPRDYSVAKAPDARLGLWRDFAAALMLTIRTERPLRRTCLAIMGATIALITAAVAIDIVGFLRTGESGQVPYIWDLGRDNGLPERLMQGCALVTAGALALCYWRRRITACLGLAGIYLFIFLDDALFYHERFGSWLVEKLEIGPAFGLRGQDQGELLAWAIAGVLLIVPLIRSWTSNVALERAVLVAFGVCLAGLGVAGGLFDMLHMIVHIRGLNTLIGIAEDGGEMIAAAAAACLALTLARCLNGRDVQPPPQS